MPLTMIKFSFLRTMKVPSPESATLFALVIVVTVEKSFSSSKHAPSRSISSSVPNLYNILSLMYRICAVDENARVPSMICLDKSMSMQVSKEIERCFRKNIDKENVRQRDAKGVEDQISEDKETKEKYIDRLSTSIGYTCSHFTNVGQWSSKHPKPPETLTKVISLNGAGRLFCVLGSVHRSLHVWERAFAECIPEITVSLKEENLRLNNK